MVLGSFEGSFRGFSEEARTGGFPSPSFGGFGFIDVASDLSIVAGWQIGSRSPMSALRLAMQFISAKKLPSQMSAFTHGGNIGSNSVRSATLRCVLGDFG